MASLLLVDDRQENLLTLTAILDSLGHELVTATSGSQALRTLLKRNDFAAILLDVQMQDMDGFEAAAVIKQRSSTSTIPIIFLTALSKDHEQVVRGYEVGAVDYVFKPFNPEILRAKVQVLVELWEKTQQVQEQAAQLAEQELAELRRATEQRYQQLADAMPQIVWTADIEGRTTYYNQRWFDYTGLEPEEGAIAGWEIAVHPDDRRDVIEKRRESLRTGGIFEAEYRMKGVDGTYRWHLGRALPIRDEDGAVDFWIGTATDLHDRKLAEEELTHRARASRVLETIADGVVLLDNEENVVLWNTAAAAITGLSAERVVGKPAPEVLPGYEQNIARVEEGGRPSTVPVEIDGRELWLSFSDGALRRRRRVRVPRPDGGARDRAGSLGLRRDRVARAAHTARRDLRRSSDAAAV